LFNVIGLLTGLVAVWVYVAIRPRFGAGIKTAIYAGLAVWLLTTLFPNVAFMHVAHLFSDHLTLYTTLGGLVEVVFGTLAGASVYRET
jgi:F0F1-type ATP synthase assembly protein I